MIKSFILLISIITLLSISCIAQTISPPNSDFEHGDYSNWIFYWGTCCTGTGLGTMTTDSLTTTPPAATFIPCSYALTGPAPATGFVAVTGIDPFGGFPVVGAGNYSLRIGSERPDYWANKADYYIHIPATATHYNIIYRYAVVLEDPGHAPDKQPRFDVTATDSNTNTIVPCANFHYVAGSLPGFVGPVSNAFAPVIGTGCPDGAPGTPINMWDQNVYYKPWATASINVSGYAGHTIIMSFAAGDCGLGAHFGYAYIDMSSGLYGVSGGVDCASATLQLVAPTGFASYQWYDSATFTTLYSTTDTLNIPAPSTTTGYAVIVTPLPGYGCIDTIYSTVYPFSAADTISGRTTLCVGDTATFTDPIYGGTWSSSSTAVATITPGSSGGEVVTGVTAGTSVITYQLPIGCFVTKTITVIPSDTTFHNTDTTACAIVGSILLNAPSGYSSYLWNTGAITSSITVVAANGQYFATALLNCSVRIDTFNVVIYQDPNVYIGNDTTICAGKEVVLADQINSGDNYLWNTGSTDSFIVVKTAGIYWLCETNSHGCKSCDTATISVAPLPTVNLGPDTEACLEYAIRVLSPLASETYIWSNGVRGPTITVFESGTYWVTASNGCGSVSSRVTVTIVPCSIAMPDAFSPNNDGANDIIYARGYGVKEFDLKIYNRYGQVVFESTDMNVGWNGTFQGQEAPVENYAYVLHATFTNGTFKTLKGNITLLR